MKTILCYGDSNTWGYHPATGHRYPRDQRWTGVLAGELGDGYAVIEEGLSGRTTVWDDPIEGEHMNGKTYLLPCLQSHQPIDLIALMLGTNDLKRRFSVSAADIAWSIVALLEAIHTSGAGPEGGVPRVLLISPSPLGEMPPESAEIYEGGERTSQRLGHYLRQVAETYGCPFLDAADVVVPSPVDGVHLDAAGHRKLGRAVARQVKGILNAHADPTGGAGGSAGPEGMAA